MAKPSFKALFQGDGDSSLRLELTSYRKGKRIEMKHYKGALPVGNCFTADAELIDDLIDGLRRFRDALQQINK